MKINPMGGESKYFNWQALQQKKNNHAKKPKQKTILQYPVENIVNIIKIKKRVYFHKKELK